MAKADAVSYLRVSSAARVEGDSFERQRNGIGRYASAHGLDLVAEYIDEGVSGTKELADRPGLADLMGRILSNGVRVVLIERADRLARDLIVSEVILRELRKAGVRVIDCSNGQDLAAGEGDDPSRKLIRQILGAVAEYEKSVLVFRMRAARDRISRKNGRRIEGRPGYGQEVVEALRDLRRKRGGKRLSWERCAARLQELGLPTKSGKPWQARVVQRVAQRAALK